MQPFSLHKKFVEYHRPLYSLFVEADPVSKRTVRLTFTCQYSIMLLEISEVLMMRVKKTSKRLLLMLCIIVCVCLFLTRSVNEIQSEGTSAQLATQIPQGMRAVTVPVSSKTMPDKALLYPGCFVDVMVTYRLSKSRIREMLPDFIVDLLVKCKLIRINIGALSTTMLRGIQVLTIRRGLSEAHVTVLVDSKQAEALSLAAQNASLSLSVRKPLDKKNDFKIPQSKPPDKIEIATQIPNGKRVVTVSVSSRDMPDRALLYPGCIVDVLVSYELSGKGAVCKTMLGGIQVLTIKRGLSEAHVTVLVDSKQAEALSLAAQNARLSLSVRNPLDKKD